MALGRREWLFAYTVKGAKASATLYSLVSTARANGLDFYAYLRRLFGELPKAKTVEDFEAAAAVELLNIRYQRASRAEIRTCPIR